MIKERGMGIKEFSKEIKIPYLLHFTRWENIDGILQYGLLPKILLEIGKYQPKNKWSTNIKIYKKIKGNLAGSFSTCWAIQNKVLGTITKSEISISGIVHPNRKRYLNLSEVKRCCSFPDTFKLTDRKNGYQRLGNSVMPKFMQAIAENIKINILDKYYKKTN